MKVILLQDVAKIGRRFSVVEVPDGYAINQLIPKKMAEPATAVNLKKIEKRQADTTASKEANEARFDAAVAALTAEALLVAAEANEQEHLFQAVHEADVVTAAKEKGIDIDAAMLKIAAPIKSLGTHEIELVIGSKKKTITIEVVKK